MRGVSRYLWRLKPTKLLSAIFLLAIVLLNWFYLSSYVHNSRAKQSEQRRSVAKETVNQEKGFRISRINQLTINLIKDGKIKHSTRGELAKDSAVRMGSQVKQENRTVAEESDKSYHHVDSKHSQSDLNEDRNIKDNIIPYTPPSNDVIQGCPKNSLNHVDMTSYGSCKPHQPTLEACQEAQRLYYVRPSKCETPFKGNICSLDVDIQKATKLLRVRCNASLCREGRDSIFVKTLNHENGIHDVSHRYSTIKQLELGLPRVMKQSHLHKYNYVFLQCEGRDDTKVLQLLPLDPRFTIQENKATRSTNQLNVNIVLLDSVSRAHFYRSLPKTINIFKRLAAKQHDNKTTNPSSSARVFDFELFQALEGHTAENTHALFTGKLFPPSRDRDAIRPVGIEKLFGHYKRAGYQTMWEEDLCWKGRWGLVTDLAVPNYNDWNALAPKLKDVYIDHTGITHSSCEVLETNGLLSPFEGSPDGKICYNGKYQHSYYLNYNLETIRAVTSVKKSLPLLSYITMSVGHEMYGRRLQTMDDDLAKYVASMAKESSTLTIILADHGNTYTRYTVTTQEGKFEMFHPSLFVIVPDKVAKLLGVKALEALGINQRRLVTMIDLHHSLMALVDSISTTGVGSRGVFTPIPSTRTCDNVELRTPNLCVCEGWDSPTTNDTLKLAFAEFAVGQMNNMLGRQGLALLQSCNRLQPLRFENVRERNSKNDGGSLLTSMDIVVPAGDAAPQRIDIFRVEVQSKQTSSKTSLDMKLVNYERMSPFGVYGVCADRGVKGKLCICSKRKKTARLWKGRLKELVQQNSNHFGSHVTFRTLDKISCLLLIERVHGNDDARAYEVANTCTDQSRSVTLTMSDVFNMKMSRDGPIEVTVSPGNIEFVFSVMKETSGYEGRISVQTMILDN